jgi:hypothetical protein
VQEGKKKIKRGKVGEGKRPITDGSRIVLDTYDVSSNIKFPESKFPERKTKLEHEIPHREIFVGT